MLDGLTVRSMLRLVFSPGPTQKALVWEVWVAYLLANPDEQARFVVELEQDVRELEG